MTASPENGQANLDFLANTALKVACLEEQSTPLFISVTKPATDHPERLEGMVGNDYTAFETDGLWVTTRPEPRSFQVPEGAVTRLDLSWDPPKGI